MQIVTAWQHVSPEVIVKGFKKFCITVEWMGLMVICCGIGVKRMGMLRVSVRNVTAQTVKMQMVTLIGRGR